MARAVVCDDCSRVSEEPTEYYSVDHWGGEEYDDSVELCPGCVPDEIRDHFDEGDSA